MVNKDEPIIWSSELSCGITLIDEQHRKLVELVNEMFNHISGNEIQEHDYFNSVIMEAVNYAKLHFATEEKLMLVINYEGLAWHEKEHEGFFRAVIDNIYNYNAENRLTLSAFAEFLKDWLLSHITNVDKQYFEYFKNYTAKKNDEN